MKIKERLKSYFIDKPKSDFWMWAFITVAIFNYLGPLQLAMLMPMQIGLVEPSIELDYEPIANKLAEKLISPMETMHEAGRDIANNNPFVGKALFYGISYLVWVYWVAMIFLILNLARYFISWVIRKSGRRF